MSVPATMAVRYTPAELLCFKHSPLAVKPPGLPNIAEWSGSADSTRNSTKPPVDRTKSHDINMLLDQTNRRPAPDRHISRSSANPEDIILGPPKTSFMSATSIRNASKTYDSLERPGTRDADSRDRYNFRGKIGEGENDRTRDVRNNNLRPKRAEGEQDSDGWSTVKPRKSFGAEGAERFNGRMGGDRHRDDRRFKDREEREVRDQDRPRGGFGAFSRDKDTELEQDRKNGIGRGRNEPSWFKDKDSREEGALAPKDRNSNGDRYVDRSRGWREKERDDRGDRGNDRGGDRRWDRDQRQEREPEWMSGPAEEKNQAHTQEDFQKWKEQMQGKDKKPSTDETTHILDVGASFFGLDRPKVDTPLEVDTGPDKFFGKFVGAKEESGSGSATAPTDGKPPTKAGKASRFTSFFAPQEEPPKRQTEPHLASTAAPLPQGGFASLFANSNNSTAPSTDDKAAFAAMLQKLQSQSIDSQNSTPPTGGLPLPRGPVPEKLQSHSITPSEPFQQYRTERQDERPSTRNAQPLFQELLVQRQQMSGSQPSIRPEQMLQELVGQRQNALSQASSRPDQPQSRSSNTDFLMSLMKMAPEPLRTEQTLLRMPPSQQKMDRQMQQQQMAEREQREQLQQREQDMQREAIQRERSASQRQARPQAPPGFFDDPAFQRGPPPQHERQSGPLQPTQILQRPPAPGMDLGWERQSQLPPPQHRIAQNVAPPPGLSNGTNRGIPMPQPMFPPGFQMGQFPPPDVMAGPPRNMQMQPPPGFFNAPPPGFMPPGMNGFQGPEGLAFGSPFDGRGPPPQGAFRRQ